MHSFMRCHSCTRIQCPTLLYHTDATVRWLYTSSPSGPARGIKLAAAVNGSASHDALNRNGGPSRGISISNVGSGSDHAGPRSYSYRSTGGGKAAFSSSGSGSSLALLHPELLMSDEAMQPPLPWMISAGSLPGSGSTGSDSQLAAQLMQELREKDSLLASALKVGSLLVSSLKVDLMAGDK